MVTIGVLALQGTVDAHLHCLELLGVIGIPIKKVDQLQSIDGLILPGGEIMSIGKLMQQFGFIEGVRDFYHEGKPIFGTNAGLCLLGKLKAGDWYPSLELINMTISRHIHGNKGYNYETEVMLPGIAVNYPALFLRPNFIEEVDHECRILGKVDGKIIAIRQDLLFGTVFHPELSDDVRIHRYFIDMVQNVKHSRKQ